MSYHIKNLLYPVILALGLSFGSGSFAANSGEIVAATKAEKKKAQETKKHAKAKAKAAKKTAIKKGKPKHSKTLKHERKSHEGSAAKHKKATKTKKHQAKTHARPHNPEHDKVVGKRPDGREIFEGPRGGIYYINDAGHKVYLPRE